MSLAAIHDLDAFGATRDSLHAVAEHVLAPYRYAHEGRIGLVVDDAGFGTPVLGDGESARVERCELAVVRQGVTRTTPLTTLAAAAAACGIEPGAPDVYTAVTTLAPDAPLAIDADACAELTSWLSFAWDRLEDLAGDEIGPTLWPEHFDAAVELGDEERGARGTFGASPGDAEHAAPYVYVTHWAETPADPFWNDSAFGGASLSYAELVSAADPIAAAGDFFTRGRALLERR